MNIEQLTVHWEATDVIKIEFYASKIGTGVGSTYELKIGNAQPYRTIIPVRYTNGNCD